MKKRFIFLVTLALMLPQVTFGAEGTKALEQVIEKVKAKIEVPEAFTEFSYNESGEDYNLMWQDLEDKQGNVRVGCDQDGAIISYSFNSYNRSEGTLAKIDFKTGEEKAKAFLQQVVPEYADALVLREEAAPSTSYYYTYVYDLYHEGVKVFNQVVRVSVSKQTGVISNFSGINFEKRTYNENKPKLSLDAAEASYLKQMELPALYKTYYDWKAKKTSSFLVYTLNNRENKGIDALTGKLVVPYKDEDNDYWDQESMANEATADKAEGATTAGLTPSEKKAVEETKGLLTTEAILEKAAVIFPRVRSAEISRNNLYQEEETYIRSLSLKDEAAHIEMSLTVDAKTGEIESYYCWSSMPQGAISYQLSKEEAAAFLSKIAPRVFKETKLIEESNNDEEMTLVSYYYGRVVNGLLVEGDGLQLTYDKCLGEITAYSKNWSKVDFKASKGMISKEEALKKIGLELVYMETKQGEYTLTYTTKERSMLLDAFTGQEVNYLGEVVQEEQQKFYTDLKGHPQEALIKKLFDSGIYLKGEQLRPNAPISQEDFLGLLCLINQGYQPLENEENEWFKEVTGKVNNQKNKPLTRQEAVYYMINATAYKKVAALGEIYIYPFKDAQYDEKMKGHISIAYGLKIINKDEKGLFRPTERLTRAEALEMIYYLLMSNESE